jgi:dethiobiotin synthetase
MSPHAAARIDNIEIDPRELHLPNSTKHLVIELAGGLMVPLNHNTLNLDLLKTWKAPVILVSKNYLGSINHTLLSLAALQTQDIPVAGIIFNGEKNESSEDFILNYSRCACLGSVETLTELNPQTIKAAAEILKPSLLKLF